MIKSVLRKSIAVAYAAVNKSLKHLEGKVVILAYHRIVTEQELKRNYVQPGMYVRRDVFDTQMSYVKDNFQLLTFSELLDHWEKKTLANGTKYCVVTFDDGWLDNYIHAFPVLLKYTIPATIFLAAGLIGKDGWMWPEQLSSILRRVYHDQAAVKTDTEQRKQLAKKHQWLLSPAGRTPEEQIEAAIERVKEMPQDRIAAMISDLRDLTGSTGREDRVMLNWAEVEEMSRKGITFGSHSLNHRILTLLPEEELKREIEDSHALLAGKGINYVPVFCYPNGNFTEAIAARLDRAGFHAAVSTIFGVEERTPSNLFGLRRIAMHNDVSSTLPLFLYRMSGYTSRSMFSFRRR